MPEMPEKALPPGSTIGILGGGQLGRMLSMAAAKLGFNCRVYCEKPDAPAFETVADHICAPYQDLDAIRRFAQGCDVVTFEFENVPLETAAAACAEAPVRPGARALEVSQDRLNEKTFLAGLGIPVAPHRAIATPADLRDAVAALGADSLLKTRRFGYDGKGQQRLDSQSDLEAAFAALEGAPAILEGYVAFECELSIVAVRGMDGAFAAYDVVRNVHDHQILARSQVPAGISGDCSRQAVAIAQAVADALDYVGVFCVELFHCGSDASEQLLANEIAPRVHNSGHWTLEACHVSQFENHVRAIAGWPLGSCERHSDAVMTNLIGPACEKWHALAADPAVSLHLYGKKEARPGRKMGHYTRLSPRTPRSP